MSKKNGKPNKKPNDIKEFSLNKDDLANIYGRLKIVDYLMALIKKDCYEYVREIILPRLGIPKDWAIMHNSDWTKITVIGPTNRKQFGLTKAMESADTGIETGNEEKIQS